MEKGANSLNFMYSCMVASFLIIRLLFIKRVKEPVISPGTKEIPFICFEQIANSPTIINEESGGCFFLLKCSQPEEIIFVSILLR